MTEEEKAESIIEMFRPYVDAYYCDDWVKDLETSVAIKCAILHVEGIIEANHRIDNKHFPTDETLDILVDESEYWQRVKEILQNNG